jgi:hypothetical protein
MKKHIFFLATFVCAVSLWAQSPETGRENFRQREPVSVSGTLVLANGFIALKSGDTLYYTGGLERLVGFIDGLKENAQVRLEGYDFSRVNVVRTQGTAQSTAQTETTHFLRVTKLEIDGRSYEINPMAGRNFPEQGPRNFQDGQGFLPTRGRGPAFGRPGHGRSGRRGFGGSGPGRHGRCGFDGPCYGSGRQDRFGGRDK